MGDGKAADSSPTPSFAFSAAPSALAAVPGGLVAVVGSKIESYGIEPTWKAEVLTNAESTPICLAVHATGQRIAVCDPSGNLQWADDDTTPARQIQLPIQRINSMLWSDDGMRIAVTDGKRIVTVECDVGTTRKSVLAEGVCGEIGRVEWRRHLVRRPTVQSPPNAVAAYSLGDRLRFAGIRRCLVQRREDDCGTDTIGHGGALCGGDGPGIREGRDGKE